MPDSKPEPEALDELEIPAPVIWEPPANDMEPTDSAPLVLPCELERSPENTLVIPSDMDLAPLSIAPHTPEAMLLAPSHAEFTKPPTLELPVAFAAPEPNPMALAT
jgi:hypothetical protein